MTSVQNKPIEISKAEDVRSKFADLLQQLSPQSIPKTASKFLGQNGPVSKIQEILNMKREAFENKLNNPNEPNQSIFINKQLIDFQKNMEQKELLLQTLIQENTQLDKQLISQKKDFESKLKLVTEEVKSTNGSPDKDTTPGASDSSALRDFDDILKNRIKSLEDQLKVQDADMKETLKSKAHELNMEKIKVGELDVKLKDAMERISVLDSSLQEHHQHNIINVGLLSQKDLSLNDFESNWKILQEKLKNALNEKITKDEKLKSNEMQVEELKKKLAEITTENQLIVKKMIESQEKLAEVLHEDKLGLEQTPDKINSLEELKIKTINQETALKSAHEETELLPKKLSTAEASVNNLQNEKIPKDYEELKKQLEVSKEQLQMASIELTKLRAEKAEMADQASLMNNKLEDLNQQIKLIENESQNLTQELEKNIQKVKKSKAEKQAIQPSQQHENVQEKLELIESALSNMVQTEITGDNKVGSGDKSVEGKTENTKKLEQELSHLKSQLIEQESELNDLSSQIETFEVASNKTNQIKQEFEDKIKQINSEKIFLEEINQTINTEKKELLEKFQKLEQSNNSLDQNSNKLQKEIEILETKIVELENVKIGTENKMSELQTEFSHANSKLGLLEKQNTQTSAELQAANLMLDKQVQELKSVESLKNIIEKSFEDFKNKTADSELENKQKIAKLMSSKNDQNSTEMQDLNQKFLDELNAENAKLKQALQVCEKAILEKNLSIELLDKSKQVLEEEVKTMKEFVEICENKRNLLDAELKIKEEQIDQLLKKEKDLLKQIRITEEQFKLNDSLENRILVNEEAMKANLSLVEDLKLEKSILRNALETNEKELENLTEILKHKTSEMEKHTNEHKLNLDLLISEKDNLKILNEKFKNLEKQNLDKEKQLVDKITLLETEKTELGNQLTQIKTQSASENSYVLNNISELKDKLELNNLMIETLKAKNHKYESNLSKSFHNIQNKLQHIPNSNVALKTLETETFLNSPHPAQEIAILVQEIVDSLTRNFEEQQAQLMEDQQPLNDRLLEISQKVAELEEERDQLTEKLTILNNQLNASVQTLHLNKNSLLSPKHRVTNLIAEDIHNSENKEEFNEKESETLRAEILARDEEIDILKNEAVHFSQKFEEINNEYFEKLRSIIEPLKDDENFGEEIEKVEQMFEEVGATYCEGLTAEEFSYVLMNLKMMINEFFQKYVACNEDAPKIKRKNKETEEGNDEDEEQKVEELTNMVLELEQTKNDLMTEIETREERISELEEQLSQVVAQFEEMDENLQETKRENEELVKQANSKKPVKQVEAETKLKLEIQKLKNEAKEFKKNNIEYEKNQMEMVEEINKKEEEIEAIKSEVQEAFEEEQNKFNEKSQIYEEEIQSLQEQIKHLSVKKPSMLRGEVGGNDDDNLKRRLTESVERVRNLENLLQEETRKFQKAEQSYTHLRQKYEKVQKTLKQIKESDQFAVENKELREKLTKIENLPRENERLIETLEKTKKNLENEKGKMVFLEKKMEKEKTARMDEMLSKPDISNELKRELIRKDEEVVEKHKELDEAIRKLTELNKQCEKLEDDLSKQKLLLRSKNRVIRKLRQGMGTDSVAKESEYNSGDDLSYINDNLEDFPKIKDSLENNDLMRRSGPETISSKPIEHPKYTEGVKPQKKSAPKNDQEQKYFLSENARRKK